MLVAWRAAAYDFRVGVVEFMRCALAVACVCLLSGVAWGQSKEVRRAQSGESCATMYQGCGEWCAKNKSVVTEKMFCESECTRYQGICEKNGIWSTALGKVEIRGLPPK